MWDFIVLGQIPGTQIRVSFDIWLIIVTVLAVGSASYIAVHSIRNSRMFAMWLIRRVLQTAAYSQMLATRRHMQA